MPRITWGGAELESALADYDHERDAAYRPYDGPKPEAPAMYQWRINRMIKGESTGGFPQLKVGLELVPRDSRDRKYSGYRMMDFIIVKKDGSTDFRVAPLIHALGLSATDFTKRTQADDDGTITRIGTLQIDGNDKLFVMGSITAHKNGSGYFDIRYWPMVDGAEGDETEGDDGDDGDDTEEGDDAEPAEAPAPAASRRGRPAKAAASTNKTPF